MNSTFPCNNCNKLLLEMTPLVVAKSDFALCGDCVLTSTKQLLFQSTDSCADHSIDSNCHTCGSNLLPKDLYLQNVEKALICASCIDLFNEIILEKWPDWEGKRYASQLHERLGRPNHPEPTLWTRMWAWFHILPRRLRERR